MNQYFGVTFVLLLGLMSDIALAEDAKATFDRGIELFDRKQYAQAADEFTKAYDAKPAWKLLYNIGQAQAGAKRYGLALNAFEKYLAQAGDEITVERQEEVLAEVRRLRDMVGELTIEGPRSAVVFVNDIKRGVLPLVAPIVLTSGLNHQLVIKFEETVLLKKTIRVRSAGRLNVSVNGEQNKKNTTSNDTQPDPENSAQAHLAMVTKLKWIGFVSAGIGGVTLVGGVAAGALALSKQRKLEKQCDGDFCEGGGNNTIRLEESRDNLAMAADILFIAGTVAAATGVVLLMVAKKKSKENLSFAPVVGPKTATFCFRRDF